MKRTLVALLIATLTLPALAADTSPATAPTSSAPATTRAALPAKKARVGIIRLADALVERPESFNLSLGSFSNPTKSPAMSSLIVTLNKAAKDRSLSGLVLDLSDFSLSLNQAHELGQQLLTLRKTGKRIALYAPDFSTPTYLLASHADTIIMPESGDLLLPGISLNMLFFKGTLDKLSITADFIQVGKYKGAEEPFTRTSPSPEYRAQIEGLVDGLYKSVIATLAANRPNVEEVDIKKALDEGWLTGKHAKEIGLIDQTMPRDQLDAWVQAQFPVGATLVDNYGQPPKKNLELDSPFALLSLMGSSPAPRSREPAIAIIYATGQIMPDQPGSEGNTALVTPSSIRKAVDTALKDDLVKAIVLRIDSPGGSASASDEIWATLKAADAKKPLTVSMGRVAASGGYYIACAGRSITADPNTITGSIGVVGGKIVLKGLLTSAGINVETISRGKHAEMLSLTRPFTDEERSFLTQQMEDVYATFSSRVMTARKDKIAKIDDVAQGRLYTGHAAQTAGLVDHVGTLQDTIAAAAKTAGLDNYQIIVLPEAKTLSDVLREGLVGAEAAAPPLEVTAALRALPLEYRTEALRVLNLIDILKKEKILMALPVGIVEEH